MPRLSESSEMIRDISPLSKVREWQSPRDTSVSSAKVKDRPPVGWGDRSDQQVGTAEPSAVPISGHPSYGTIERSPPDSPESPKWSTELDWVFALFVFLVFGSQVSCSFAWVLAWAECGVDRAFWTFSQIWRTATLRRMCWIYHQRCCVCVCGSGWFMRVCRWRQC